MDNIFRVLCIFSNENVELEFKELYNKLQGEKSLRINPRKVSIDHFPVNFLRDYYDVVILDILEGEGDLAASRMMLNFNEEFNHSQLIAVCNLNLRDFPELSLSTRDTRSFLFGTCLEAINRIISIHYLFEKEQHLL